MSDQTTPPPPAGPYGGPPQGQPYGSPQYGGAPQGQPYGTPPPPPGGQPPFGGQPAFGGQEPPAQPPKKKSAAAKVLGIVGIIIVALVVVGLKAGLRDLISPDDKTADAKVGDCIGELPAGEGQETSKSAEIVKCDDAAAKYSVVGRVENQTEAQAKSEDACGQFKEAEYVYYTLPEDGGTGYVLCLKPVAAK